MYHGKGVSTHVNFFRYEGQFKKGLQDGVGSETWPDGSSFLGNYIRGKRNGYGVQKWADNQSYAGNYKDGLIEGFGTYTWSDGREFVGEWKNQKIYGLAYKSIQKDAAMKDSTSWISVTAMAFTRSDQTTRDILVLGLKANNMASVLFRLPIKRVNTVST